MSNLDEEDIFHGFPSTSKTDTTQNFEISQPSLSFTDLKIDLAQDGSPTNQTRSYSTRYSNLSTRYNFAFFDGTTPRFARPKGSPTSSSTPSSHMTNPLFLTTPPSTPPNAKAGEARSGNLTIPDQNAAASYELKFGLITPPPTPATSELTSPKPTTESGPNLTPLTSPPTPPYLRSTPTPAHESSNCFFNSIKTKTKSTPQHSQVKQRGFQVVHFSPSPGISEEVEAGTKCGLGKKCRELSALELSREKRKIMVRKLKYGMEAEVREIVRRTNLVRKETELERGYGLGIWKETEGGEEEAVESTLGRMSLWFAQSRLG